MKQVITEEEYERLNHLRQFDFVRTAKHRPRLQLSGYPNTLNWVDGFPAGIHWDDDFEVEIFYTEK